MEAGVGDDELEEGLEFAILEDDSGLAEAVEVGKDLGGAAYGCFFAADVDGVGAEVDGDAETVFEEAKVFVAGSVEGFDAGGDVECFFDQAGF